MLIFSGLRKKSQKETDIAIKKVRGGAAEKPGSWRGKENFTSWRIGKNKSAKQHRENGKA